MTSIAIDDELGEAISRLAKLSGTTTDQVVQDAIPFRHQREAGY